MTHLVQPFLLGAIVIYFVITVLILSTLIYNRSRYKIKALDYMVVIFGFVMLTVISQIFLVLFHEDFKLFNYYKGDDSPLFLNPVRDFSLIGIIFVYILSEHILNEKVNSIRVSIIVSCVVIYLLVPIFHYNTGNMIWVNQILPFGRKTRLDELVSDVVWILSLFLAQYAFFRQYRVSVNSEFRNKIFLVYLGIAIYNICYVYELLEHFLSIPDIDASLFSLPMFLSFGYVYLTKPNFAYYTPSNISFLQIATADGLLIYTADLRDDLSESNEFLLTMSISSINSLLREIVDPVDKRIRLKSIDFDKGSILLEQIGSIIVMLHTDNPSYILRRSMRYLIQEFTETYHDKIGKTKAGIHSTTFPEVELLIQRCIPVIQSKVLQRRKKIKDSSTVVTN